MDKNYKNELFEKCPQKIEIKSYPKTSKEYNSFYQHDKLVLNIKQSINELSNRATNCSLRQYIETAEILGDNMHKNSSSFLGYYENGNIFYDIDGNLLFIEKN